MKQLVKALDKDSACFEYICQSFHCLCMQKLKAGIFNNIDIFSNFMNGDDLFEWSVFVEAIKISLGNSELTITDC